jgi:hypothetical protein
MAVLRTLTGCGVQPASYGSGGDAGSPSAATAAAAEPASDAAVAFAKSLPRADKASPFDDSGAVTRLGLYATPDEAARVLAARPGGALRVKVDRGGDEAAALAVNLVWGEQAASDLPRSAPVFVTGDDLRLAATVVDRLEEGGLTRVYLVGPRRAAGPQPASAPLTVQ